MWEREHHLTSRYPGAPLAVAGSRNHGRFAHNEGASVSGAEPVTSLIE